MPTMEHDERRRQLERVGAALRANAATLIERPGELASQLASHLSPDDGVELGRLLASIRGTSHRRWLEPLFPGMRGGIAVTVLPGHADVVSALAFTDDDRLLSSSRDGTIRVWNLPSGRPLYVLGHHGSVVAMGVSEDRRTAVALDRDGIVSAWDLDSGSGRGDPTPSQQDARVVRVAGVGESVEVDLQRQEYEPGDAGLPIASSAGDRVVVRGTGDEWAREKSDIARGTVEVDDSRGDRHLVLTGHRDKVQAVAISTDGTRAVSRDDSGVVWIWDLESGLPLGRIDNAPGAMGLSRSGLVVTSESSGRMHVWSTSPDDLALGHAVPVVALAMAEAEDIAVSIASHEQEHLWVWDLSGAAEHRHRWVGLGGASAVTLGPSGRWAYIGYENGDLHRESLDVDLDQSGSVSRSAWEQGPHRYEDRDVARIVCVPTEAIVVCSDENAALTKTCYQMQVHDLGCHDGFSSGDLDEHSTGWPRPTSTPAHPRVDELRLRLAQQEQQRLQMADRLEIDGPTLWVRVNDGSRLSFTVGGSRITAWDAHGEIVVIGDDAGRVHALRCHT